LFQRLGIEVLNREPSDVSSRTLSRVGNVLVLLSAHLRASHDDVLTSLLEPLGSLGSPGSHRQPETRAPRVITVRLDGTRPIATAQASPGGLPDVVNLAGLDETAAVAAVLQRFGPPGASDQIALGPGSGLRFPGQLPEVWNVARRAPHFTGRAALLSTLRERLNVPVGAPGRVQALLGMGGVGKSAIALEYAHRFASDYDVVWWVTASEPEAARESLARLAREFGPDAAPEDGEGWESLRRSLWRGEPYDRWLLILDDAGEPGRLREFVPDTGHGHVLITSQHSAWDREAQPLDVIEFDRPESMALLGERLPRARAADLDRLAEALGDLPMALDHVAASLRTAPVTVAEFVRSLTDAGRPALDLAAVHHLTAEWLERESPAAARLLDLCAFLSPDGISFRVIQSQAMRDQLAAVDPRLSDSMRVRQVLTTLVGRSLARVDQATETVTVHRLIQLLRRRRMTPERRGEIRRQVLAVLASLAPSDIEADDPRHASVFAELDKHLLVSGAVRSDDPEVRRWVANQVRYRWRRNQWTAARDLGERVLADWRQRFPEDIPTLRLATQVANVHRSLGAYAKAFEMDRETLRIQHRVQGRHDPYTLMTLRGYAAGLRAQGDFQGALAEDQATYKGFVAAFGEDHPDTLLAAANLSLSWYFMGSVENAIRQGSRTLELRTRVLTEQDPMTWWSHIKLGTYYRNAGRLDDSAAHLVRAVRRLTELEGKDAPRTLRAMKSLGLTYLAAGNLTDAVPLLRDVGLAAPKRWGDDHPETMASVLAVAAVQHVRGQAAEAADSVRDVLGRFRARLGDDHPFTAMCRSNLALYLLDGGQADEARELTAQAVNQLTHALRADHPFTLVARMNLNNAMAAAEGTPPSPRILAEDEDIHDGCRKRWGPEHAVTLTAEANLAHSTGNTEALRAAAIRCEQRLGEDHQLTRRLTADPYQRVGAALEIEEA
jgi:tetratricopeptide (TPR) repeat protein